MKNNSCIDLAISALKQYKNDDETDDDSSGSCMHFVQFVIEQLNLMQLSKSGRRYSCKLLAMAFLWKLTSSSLYKRLSEFFFLPSTRRLQQLSVDLNVETKKVDTTFLKQRVSNFTEGERAVVLLIDEVYTAQRVEYSNGSYVGLTEEGRPAKTVLAFMVQSVCKKYSDVVCLVPIERINTKILKSYFDLVMDALNEILFCCCYIC